MGEILLTSSRMVAKRGKLYSFNGIRNETNDLKDKIGSSVIGTMEDLISTEIRADQVRFLLMASQSKKPLPAFVDEGHLLMIDFKIQIANGKVRERLSAIKTKMMAETSREFLQILQTQTTVATKDEQLEAAEMS